MFDLKPHAPNGVGGEFRPIATTAAGVDVCELLPLTARWMHKSAVVRSVYHYGGCHKNLPMYTGFDVNLPDEEFRDSDPPSMGSVCAYLERDRQKSGSSKVFWGGTHDSLGKNDGHCFHPEGMSAISRGLSNAIPPVEWSGIMWL